VASPRKRPLAYSVAVIRKIRNDLDCAA